MIALVFFIVILAVLVIGGLMKPAQRTWHQCAWCQWWFSDCGDEQIAKPECVTEVSHGICEECRGEKMKELGTKI